MYNLLSGMRVVEGAAFVAGPSCGLYLAQMGAEVIRFDNIGGGPDANRWPLTTSGASLYWEGLNKGKKSVALNLSSPEGRELAAELATSPGDDNGGMFLTNYPVKGFLSYERLVERRPDLISLRVMGWADGGPAVDYTINAAVGVPLMTGPAGGGPVNHVLPAWDLLAGAYTAFMLVAAERHRRLTGEGREIRVPLSDIAAATLSNLGQVAEVLLSGDRPQFGNAIYGAFGRDFATRDGRVMVVAITPRQWKGLVETLGLVEQVSRLEAELGVSFEADEGNRFAHRERLFPLFEAAFTEQSAETLQPVFASRGVCWAPYQTLGDAVSHDERLFVGNPIFQEIDHPSGARYTTAGSPATLVPGERESPVRAPRLGEHTEEVLTTVLNLSSGQIADLHDRGIVASAKGD